MIIEYSKDFLKDIKSLNQEQKNQLRNRILLFQNKPSHPQLKNHPLKGKLKGFHSINITGDIRAIYTCLEKTIKFVRLGTHSQLY